MNLRLLVTCEIKRQRADRRQVGAWDVDSEHLSERVLEEIVEALRASDNHVSVVNSRSGLLELAPECRRQYDLAVNLSVGYGGPDTKAYCAALLQSMGLEYIGSAPYALVVSRDKALTKCLARELGIRTPAWLRAKRADVLSLRKWSSYPAIVKPIHESCSIGITTESVVYTRETLHTAVHRVWDLYEQPALVEAFVPGFDLEVPLIGHPTLEALGVVAVLPAVSRDRLSILTSPLVYQDAYYFRHPGGMRGWNAAVGKEAESWALQIASALGIRDYGRCDFRLDSSGCLWFIEASTHPYLARRSSFAHCLNNERSDGYVDLWQRLLACGAQRVNERQRTAFEHPA